MKNFGRGMWRRLGNLQQLIYIDTEKEKRKPPQTSLKPQEVKEHQTNK
jgi:hypothetical protein